MTKLFILLANILLPVTAIILSLSFKEVPYRWIFVLAITAHVCVRMWETFYTSKEKNPQKFEGDWTLAVGTFAYIGMLFVVTFEFYLYPKSINFVVFAIGVCMYGVATRLRWWGAVTLGSQWAIHVIGKQKTQKARLLHIGPFVYIRHPIYLGILVEELAVPLIAGTFYSMICVMAVNIPLLMVRLFFEEHASEKKFDRFSYNDYKMKTGIFFPKSHRLKFVFNLLAIPIKKSEE